VTTASKKLSKRAFRSISSATGLGEGFSQEILLSSGIEMSKKGGVL